MRIQKLTTLALFTTLALGIYAVESALPAMIPIPGIKPGLANIITLVLLHRYSAKDTLTVLLARILLSTLLFGQAMSLLYSLAGGLACLALMYPISRLLHQKHIYITGIMGALAHNMAQLLVAFGITQVAGVFVYCPFLLLSGIVTGCFTGLCCHFLLKYLPLPTVR
ncbi:MAG: Gx transporter family protein [Lachnospiraceae bacterium]|nr:Gx transporter family protein [Lachnospiraceae bacterium]